MTVIDWILLVACWSVIPLLHYYKRAQDRKHQRWQQEEKEMLRQWIDSQKGAQ